MTASTVTAPRRAAYFLRLPSRELHVYMAPESEPPSYGEVLERGLNWPSMASAVTALEVESWHEVGSPRTADKPAGTGGGAQYVALKSA